MNRPHFIRAKDNPFAVQRVTTLPYRFESGDWESHLTSLAKLRFRAAIVGPQGSGKSTLLRDVAVKLTANGYAVNYIIVPRVKGRHPPILGSISRSDRSQIKLIDGVERLSPWNRVRLHQSVARLIVTVHSHQILPPFRLPTWIQTRPSMETVEYMLGQIGLDNATTVATAEQLFDDHAGNVRSVMRDLYDRYGQQVLS